MPLPETKFKDAELEAFLDSHYEFRCQKQYKGFFGRSRAFFDRLQAEKIEAQEEHEHEIRAQMPDIVFHSDPFGWKPESDEISARTENLESSFSKSLRELLEAKNKSNVEVYKRANIDRKLFSKIINENYYMPSKRTIISLALALELSLEETQTLLKRAGFTLSRSILFDVIIEYYLDNKKYDLFEINEVLAAYNLTTLGSKASD